MNLDSLFTTGQSWLGELESWLIQRGFIKRSQLPPVRMGTGSPETKVIAAVGSLWLRTDGGAATTLYVKESGTGNTGWVAK